jgi:hypothetical protein
MSTICKIKIFSNIKKIIDELKLRILTNLLFQGHQRKTCFMIFIS